MGADVECIARLVEPDVPVAADAENLQVDAACRSNRLFIALALDIGRGRGTVEEVNAGWNEIDALEQIALHELAKAAWMIRADADELVEVERGRAREIRLPLCMKPPQLRVSVDRRPARCQPKDNVRLRAKRHHDLARQRVA